MEDLEERIRSLVVPVLARHGADLVDVQVKKGRTQLVRVVADTPEGITLDTCTKVNKELGRMLDVEDPFEGRYTLEVTSPGLDRPLRTGKDFGRNIGRQVKVVLAQGQHEGVIEEVGETSVTLECDGERVEISLDGIAKATLVLP